MADVNSMIAIYNELNDKPREAAEYAFAIAITYKDQKQHEDAEKYGRLCIKQLDECALETLEQCAPIHLSIEGVIIPEIFHQDVVRNRLNLQ